MIEIYAVGTFAPFSGQLEVVDGFGRSGQNNNPYGGRGGIKFSFYFFVGVLSR